MRLRTPFRAGDLHLPGADGPVPFPPCAPEILRDLFSGAPAFLERQKVEGDMNRVGGHKEVRHGRDLRSGLLPLQPRW